MLQIVRISFNYSINFQEYSYNQYNKKNISDTMKGKKITILIQYKPYKILDGFEDIWTDFKNIN
jgi:hypothetical protein